jgi:hypothetical protein
MMAATACAPRFRSTVAGPEADLVEAAMQSGLLRWTTKPIVLREPELGAGFPDVVAAFPASGYLRVDRAPLRHDHLRLLQFLWTSRGATTVDTASILLRMPPAATRRITAELREQGAIIVDGDRLRVDRATSVFAATRIVAIEAKISKWEEALLQAQRNAWFASHSYVLLPSRALGRRAVAPASTAGIGVLVLDKDRIVTMARARARRLPASLGSWIVNEWMIRELSCEAR